MPLACRQCGEEFSSERELQVHQRQAHSHPANELVGELGDIESVETGIMGFDSLMSEGIPKGSSVLVEGGPGSGKTIFCLQVAYNACERGEKVLYMSFEEPVHRLMHHMIEFGWDIEPHLEDRLKINRYHALDIARSVEALLSEAKRELLIEVKPMLFPEDFEPDIVLFDSLTSIASAFSGERSRFRIYMEQLFKYLENEDITSFLIRETPNPAHIGMQNSDPSGGAVSFLSDGIFTLYNAVNPSGDRDRAIEIVKLRGEDFQSGIVEMEISSDGGIHVYPDQPLEGEYTLT